MMDAEKGVLGCALLGAADDCLSKGVTVDSFAHDDNRKIWGAIKALSDESQPVSLATVYDRVKPEVSISTITQCEDMAPTSGNLGYWLPTVKKNTIRRQYRAKVNRLVAALDDKDLDPEELTAAFEAEILDYGSNEETEESRSEEITRLMGYIEDVQYKGKMLGYSTGFPNLDDYITGLEKQKMYVIAGRPGSGKTTIAQNLAKNLVEKGIPTLIFSCEMTKDQLNLRMLAAESRINSRDLTTPNTLTPSHFAPITSAAGRMVSWPLYIKDKSDMKISQIRAEARRMKRLHGIKVVMVDYLQLLDVDESNKKSTAQRHEDVGNISGNLKNMAKELDVPVVALAQLNRETEKSGRAPKASDLRESGKIEADADLVACLWEPEPEKRPSRDHSIVECVICKNRHGSTGITKFLFKKDVSQFEPISRFDDEDITT
jgi:replicative DNA helicase